MLRRYAYYLSSIFTLLTGFQIHLKLPTFSWGLKSLKALSFNLWQWVGSVRGKWTWS
jgi:hypothetical protein